MLEVTGVSKYYGALAAVRDVSFTARPGEVLAYLGPNGSGKSTTVNMVAGLLEPTDGEIRVHGENIRHDLLGHRRRIGYVPETPDLYSYLTGPEYLTLVGRLRQMEPDVLDEKIERFLRLFDIYDDRYARLDEAVRVPGGVGFDNEREQFRVLFPAFLRRLFENDLVPETVDLRQSALWLAALLTIPPAIFAITLSLFYGSWMTDERLALRSVPHKLYFIGYSMAAVGLLTVLVWNALFPDRRDAMLLGGLPIRTRTVVAAKLSALVAFVVGFAVVINAPATALFSLVAGGYLPFGAFVRYPVAHFITTVSAGLLVFLALAALQTSFALVLPARLLRRVSMLAQLLFVIVLIEWLAFAPGLLVRLAAIDPSVTSEALAAAENPYQFVGLASSRAGTWLPPVWFLGLYEVIWGFDPDVFRRLAMISVIAVATTGSIAALAYCAAFRRIVRQALEAPPAAAPRAAFVSRIGTRLASATIVRHPVEQAIVAFAARSLARSRPHRLLVAAYGGLGLAFVIGSFLSPVTGIAESALSESLSTPSVRLLSIPFVLSFFILVALRVLFTVPTEIDANRVFRMTEIDDKAVYLSGSRKAMWLLGALPIAVVTLPACAWLWGPALALGHTVFWLLMAGGLTELLLYRFHKVPFACGYVPGKANVKYLWPVYALVLTAYAYWTARLELWILTDPVRWSIGCATLGTCLALAIAYRRRMLRSSNPLTYDQAASSPLFVTKFNR